MIDEWVYTVISGLYTPEMLYRDLWLSPAVTHRNTVTYGKAPAVTHSNSDHQENISFNNYNRRGYHNTRN